MSGFDTIFALSSGSGRAGVAVIRVSGPRAAIVVDRLCRGTVLPGRVNYRRIVDPQSGAVLDSGLVLFFPGPASFTGEDVAEFQVHGSIAVVRRLIAVLASFEGCRAADAGEFTRRAFLNGKLDLLDIEALGDLLAAETEAQRKLAVDGSRRLRSLAADWRRRLVLLRGMCEAYIDFSDEGDVSNSIDSESERELIQLRDEIEGVLGGLQTGIRVRAGFRVAVLGPPNSGKSTLVNALADREVSITSAVAGTTRDVVEAHLDLGGLPVIVVDTAGIREDGSDPIENEGIRRARVAADGADLVIWVECIDSLAKPRAEAYLLVRSKADLGIDSPGCDGLPVSARTGEGMTGLVQAIRERCAQLDGDGTFGAVIAHQRQADRLRSAVTHLDHALAFSDVTLDMRAEEFRLACEALDLLVGRVGSEEVLDIVFAQFCIGK